MRGQPGQDGGLVLGQDFQEFRIKEVGSWGGVSVIMQTLRGFDRGAIESGRLDYANIGIVGILCAEVLFRRFCIYNVSFVVRGRMSSARLLRLMRYFFRVGWKCFGVFWLRDGVVMKAESGSRTYAWWRMDGVTMRTLHVWRGGF
jgi:hypothetical protein